MPTTARLYALEQVHPPRQLRAVMPRRHVAPAAKPVVRPAAFSPLEEDFFARAADLYPKPDDEVDEWDRLYAAVKAGL